MRFIPDKRKSRRHSVIDLTPLIDVVMLIIIFFMTTAQFARMTQANVDLPRQKGEEHRQENNSELVINITAEGRYIVDGIEADLETVRRKTAFELALAGDNRDLLQITIRADRHAVTAPINKLIAALSELGVKSSSLAVEVR